MSKTTVETPRRLAALSQVGSQANVPQDDPPEAAVAEAASYRMPSPRLPFVSFRFSGSDEAAYGVILRRGDRSLDLGVFAANHRTIQQMDGVRHSTDPDLARMAEFLPGIWQELPEVEDFMSRLEAVESVLDALTR